MGDWDRNANWNRDVLERIAALLFALANLAELAAGAPFFRRRRVLEILSFGEAEARAFVLGAAVGSPTPVDAMPDALEHPGDALRLAASFRALALLFCALLARPFARRRTAASRTGADKPAWPAGRQAPLAAPDTS